MAKNRSIKEQIKILMLKHPGVGADKLYPLASFKTKKSYFDIIYNEHKYQSYPQTKGKLKRKYPKLYQWVHANYEDTDLKITEIAEKFKVEQLLVVHIKKVLGLLKYPSESNGIRDTVFHIPEKLKKPSIALEVGDIIEVTKHVPADLRDIFVCGRCQVIFKNKWHVVIKDAIGLCHSFNIQLFDNYIEYREVSN